ncbi:3'-5' exonuclease [Clostridium cylindrosporum]|uniref:Exonuclease domain-containing protein n=1 Tax=Clostridium cylindrosporum DSM 605 TaxID=1121307 RepID=A0A0J8D9S6_CLOCY|nr:3'-5' exonuclease [Clostridium cylindrosporum]KMT21043.1 hypothetical protein CLCY_1c02770 [Clostridium cylindrosporum DSM 605]
MHYIIFDLEFNQDFSSTPQIAVHGQKYPFEIIQIGAIKLDSNLRTVSTFNRYIKPTIYSKISPFITELTGITTKQLLVEKSFPNVYRDFIDFIDDKESIFCIWGPSDIKEIFRNADYHKLDRNLLPKMFINIQSYVSKHLGFSSKNLIGLQNAVDTLNIPKVYEFHNAFYDAYYTSEIFKKIYTSSIEPKQYNPSYVRIKPRKQKVDIDYDGLMGQFSKMYDREMTQEEQEIIKLAYKMGRTHQFIKKSSNEN